GRGRGAGEYDIRDPRPSAAAGAGCEGGDVVRDNGSCGFGDVRPAVGEKDRADTAGEDRVVDDLHAGGCVRRAAADADADGDPALAGEHAVLDRYVVQRVRGPARPGVHVDLRGAVLVRSEPVVHDRPRATAHDLDQIVVIASCADECTVEGVAVERHSRAAAADHVAVVAVVELRSGDDDVAAAGLQAGGLAERELAADDLDVGAVLADVEADVPAGLRTDEVHVLEADARRADD